MTVDKETLSTKLADYELERPKGYELDTSIFEKPIHANYFDDVPNFESSTNLKPVKPNLGASLMKAMATALENEVFPVSLKSQSTVTTIKVTEDNLTYITSLLQQGDLVSYRVSLPHDPEGKLHSNLMLRELIWQLDLQPLIGVYNKDLHSFHSSHLVEVTLVGPRRKVKPCIYEPTGFLCSYYSGTSQVVEVLKNAYGHRPSWKRTLYDVGAISQYLFDNKIKKSKRKATILQLAPHSKLNIASVLKETEKEAMDYYNQDSYLDY